MTSEEKITHLERLKHYQTRYEVIATSPAGERRLIAYTSLHSGRGLLSLLTSCGSPELLAHVSPTDDGMEWGKERLSLIFPGGGSVSFSGRTQRDAINGGELPEIVAPSTFPAGSSAM